MSMHAAPLDELPADLRRYLHRTTTASGMVRIEMQLSPEQAEVVWAAMHVALDVGTSAGATESAAVRASAESFDSGSTLAARGGTPRATSLGEQRGLVGELRA